MFAIKWLLTIALLSSLLSTPAWTPLSGDNNNPSGPNQGQQLLGDDIDAACCYLKADCCERPLP